MSITLDKPSRMANKPKRGVGRPKKAVQSQLVSGRIHPDVAAALAELSELNKRSVSAEIGTAAEDLVIKHEERLRRSGKWTPVLEKLKQQQIAGQ
jgi:hypothetical protein